MHSLPDFSGTYTGTFFRRSFFHYPHKLRVLTDPSYLLLQWSYADYLDCYENFKVKQNILPNIKALTKFWNSTKHNVYTHCDICTPNVKLGHTYGNLLPHENECKNSTFHTESYLLIYWICSHDCHCRLCDLKT